MIVGLYNHVGIHINIIIIRVTVIASSRTSLVSHRQMAYIHMHTTYTHTACMHIAYIHTYTCILHTAQKDTKKKKMHLKFTKKHNYNIILKFTIS